VVCDYLWVSFITLGNYGAIMGSVSGCGYESPNEEGVEVMGCSYVVIIQILDGPRGITISEGL